MAERLGTSIIEKTKKHWKKAAVAGAAGIVFLGTPSAVRAADETAASADIPLNIVPGRALELAGYTVIDIVAFGGVIYLANKREKKPIDKNRE